MKKFIVSAATLVVLAASLAVFAQNQAAPAGPSQGTTGPIGLVDMAHVFKNYKKFEIMTKDLQAEIKASEEKLKLMAENLKALAAKGQELKGIVKETSPEFIEHEKAFTQAQSDFETARKVEQREFLRKEAQIYKTIYLEVADAVEQAAKYYNLSVVLRFSREEIDEAGDPKELIQSMNRQVVYHRSEDDITDDVVRFLNKNYERAAGGGAAAPAAAAAAPKTASAAKR